MNYWKEKEIIQRHEDDMENYLAIESTELKECIRNLA